MEMSMTLYAIILTAFIAYVVVSAAITARRMKQEKAELKISRYKKSMIKIWALTAIIICIVFVSSISFYDIGFRPLDFTNNSRPTIMAFVACGVLLVHMIMPLLSAKYRDRMTKRYSKDLATSLPCNNKERLWWVAVSMTAGVTEEIIFRGFLFYLLIAVFPAISTVMIIVAASAVFGLCHMYQGINGIIMTAAIGALLGYLFIATGSLIPVILLHFIIDLANVFVLPHAADTKIIAE